MAGEELAASGQRTAGGDGRRFRAQLFVRPELLERLETIAAGHKASVIAAELLERAVSKAWDSTKVPAAVRAAVEGLT